MSLWDSPFPWRYEWRDDWPLREVELPRFSYLRFAIIRPKVTGFLFNIAAGSEVTLSLEARIRDRKRRMKRERKLRIKASNAAARHRR